MKYLEPYGQVVVPIGGDGKPRGVAYWCDDEAKTAELIHEQGGVMKTYSLIVYREVPREENAADLEAARVAMNSGQPRVPHDEVLSEFDKKD